MKIEVKNFGKIKKGQIDLDKKVTVFVGYNNSGKTYMSQLLWGIYSNDDYLYIKQTNSISNEMIKDDILEITPDLLSNLFEEINYKFANVFLPNIFNKKSDYFSVDNFLIRFTELIENIKQIPIKFLMERHNIELEHDLEGFYYIEKKENSFELKLIKRDIEEPKSWEEYVLARKIMLEEFGNENYFNVIHNKLSNIEIFVVVIYNILRILILSDKHIIPFFLPANRAFYPTFYKYIYSVAKDEKDMIDIRIDKTNSLDSLKALSKRPYTKPSDNLIKKIFELNINYKGFDIFDDLLEELKLIIGGEIIFKSSEGIAPIEFYLKLDNGKELDMYMASSSANQLATLYLYFKYWAFKENNFLIIDEPEENLHPENQIKLVNILMKFADRNNKVLITTHSPLITDMINNYANISKLNEEDIDTEKLIKDNGLDLVSIENIQHKDFGIYFFNGETIKEYEVGDYGAYFRDFQNTQDKINEMTIVLKDSIYENSNKK